jgi:hypothetical protein
MIVSSSSEVEERLEWPRAEVEVLETPNCCEFEQAESVTMCARAREGEGKLREVATSMELT